MTIAVGGKRLLILYIVYVAGGCVHGMYSPGYLYPQIERPHHLRLVCSLPLCTSVTTCVASEVIAVDEMFTVRAPDTEISHDIAEALRKWPS